MGARCRPTLPGRARLRHADRPLLGPGPWRLLLGGRGQRAMRRACPTSSSMARPSPSYALSEHALATRLARGHRGSRRRVRRDRRPLPRCRASATTASSCCATGRFRPPRRVDYLADPAGVRTHNTRIHLLEALTTYHELSRAPLVARRLAGAGGADRGRPGSRSGILLSYSDGARADPPESTATISRPSVSCCAPAPGSAAAATRRRSIAGSSTTPCGWARTPGLGGMFDSGVIGAAADRQEAGLGAGGNAAHLVRAVPVGAPGQRKRPSCARSTGSAAGRSIGQTARGTAIDPRAQPVGKKAGTVEQPVPHRPRGAGLPTRARRHRGGRRQRRLHADLMGGTIAVFGLPHRRAGARKLAAIRRLR